METGIYAFVIESLVHGPFTYEQVAAGSGVNKRTVEKIARKEIVDPGVSHIEKMAKFFRAQPRKPGSKKRRRS